MINTSFNEENLLDRKLFILQKDRLLSKWYLFNESNDWINWFFTKKESINIYTVTKNNILIGFYFDFFDRGSKNYWFYPMYKSKNLMYDIFIMFNELKIDIKSLEIDF